MRNSHRSDVLLFKGGGGGYGGGDRSYGVTEATVAAADIRAEEVDTPLEAAEEAEATTETGV